MRKRGGITPAARARIDTVRSILDELRAYWPVTLRQAYYQLVARGLIENRLGEYKRLSVLLTKARLAEIVPWECIEDRARRILRPRSWTSADDFLAAHRRGLLQGYRRDVLATQPEALEVWVEKDALAHVCRRAADPFGVPVVVARGFSSVSYLRDCRERVVTNAIDRKQRTRILYFGDLDPSGWEMLPAMLETLQREMELDDLVVDNRCALNPEQVAAHGLPTSPEALKATDSRAKKYVRRFGPLAVELDAPAPPVLEALVRASIEQHLDIDLLAQERRKEADDAERIGAWRARVQALMADLA